MRLATLLEALPEKIVTGSRQVVIRDIVHDSRLVAPGDLFVAVREPSGHDGHRHIGAAIDRGAAAVVRESETDGTEVTMIRVPDSNRALSLLADARYGHPGRALTLVGVTGTNGKTTVTHLVEAILRAAGQNTGLIGTLGARLNGEPLDGPPTHTTPYPMQLHGLLRTMADRASRYAVMEVSSVALAYDRLSPLRFQAAVFTNLTRDHLDLHGSFDAYCDAKLRLVRDFLAPDGVALINRDDPLSDRFVEAAAGTPVTYGIHHPADITVEGRIAVSGTGASFRIRTREGVWFARMPLLGRYNVANALAAFGVGRALGVPPPDIIKGLESVTVPGRLERIEAGQPYTVVVDYAHTPDALCQVLMAAREWTPGRLIAVFGCGGNRDPGKRPEMGGIASRLADLVVITSDNPRSEAPNAIIRHIEAGLVAGVDCLSLCDRREAIAAAFMAARAGDTVVIAGKGHETYQEISGNRYPFDDREVARELLRQRSSA